MPINLETPRKFGQLISQANQQYANAQAALKQGDLATYANDMQQVGSLLQQAASLANGSGASTSPSPKPSG